MYALLSSIDLSALGSDDSAPAALRPMENTARGRPAEESYYGFLELRHHLNTYYGDGNEVVSREPTMNLRLQLGKLLYNGRVDAFLTVGMIKIPKTLQILERRPEFQIDFYPYKDDIFVLRQYSMARLPGLVLREEDLDDPLPTPQPNRGTQLTTATEFIFGLAPYLQLNLSSQRGMFHSRLGFDVWTSYYSQRQFTKTSAPGPEVEIEDDAPKLTSKQFLTLGYQSSYLKDVLVEGSIYYDSKFYPVYVIADEKTNTSYKHDRFSFYKIRFQYDVTNAFSVVNDFYHFNEEFFVSNVHNGERRYRNVFRIICKL